MNSHIRTPRRLSRGRMAVCIAAFMMALVATLLPTSSAQAVPEPLSRLGVQQNTMTCATANDGTIIVFGVIGTSVAQLDQYPVKIEDTDATWGYKDPDGGNYQLVGLTAGTHTLTVPGYYGGPMVQFTVKPCAPPDVELTVTPSTTSGSTGDGTAKVTAYGHYVFEETFTVKLDGVVIRDDFFLTATYPGSPISVNDFTLVGLVAKTYTLRLEGNKGNVVERPIIVPLSGSSPSPTPPPTPTPTISVTPTPEPTTPAPVFKPTASLTSGCVSLVGTGWSQVFKATYRNTGTAPGSIDRTVVLHGAAVDPWPVSLAPGQTLVEYYPYPNTGEYGKGDVKMLLSAPGMATVALGDSVDISKCRSADAWITSNKYGKFCVRVATSAPNKVYWEDGYRSGGAWKFGRNHYLTKSGGPKTYCGNGPNVGNGRGKVNTNKIRVTVISGTTAPLGLFPQRVVKDVEVLTFRRR